jgi:hypothetical protein
MIIKKFTTIFFTAIVLLLSIASVSNAQDINTCQPDIDPDPTVTYCPPTSSGCCGQPVGGICGGVSSWTCFFTGIDPSGWARCGCFIPSGTPTPPPSSCIPSGSCLPPGESCCSGVYDFDISCPTTEQRCGTATTPPPTGGTATPTPPPQSTPTPTPIPGQCLSPCTTQADCDPNYSCLNNICWNSTLCGGSPPPTSTPPPGSGNCFDLCSTNADCNSPLFCDIGKGVCSNPDVGCGTWCGNITANPPASYLCTYYSCPAYSPAGSTCGTTGEVCCLYDPSICANYGGTCEEECTYPYGSVAGANSVCVANGELCCAIAPEVQSFECATYGANNGMSLECTSPSSCWFGSQIGGLVYCNNSSQVCCNMDDMDLRSQCTGFSQIECTNDQWGGWFDCAWCNGIDDPLPGCPGVGCYHDPTQPGGYYGNNTTVPSGCLFSFTSQNQLNVLTGSTCTNPFIYTTNTDPNALTIFGYADGGINDTEWRVVSMTNGEVLAQGITNRAIFAIVGAVNEFYVIQFRQTGQAWPSVTNLSNPELCGPSDIDTAIGCIPVGDLNALATFILRWGAGIGGGVAFVLIIYATILIITSTGNPHKLQAGKELLSAAIAGLLLLIFSVFVLRLIGVDILRIPGLTGGGVSTPPPAPTCSGAPTLNMSQECNNGIPEISLNWSSIAGFTSYELQYDHSGNCTYIGGVIDCDFANASSVIVTGTTYTISAQSSPNFPYYIRVRPNGCGSSTWSNITVSVSQTCS